MKDLPDRQRAQKIISILSKLYPNAIIALNYSNPLELLVATMLSAQCTDERVNLVTRSLFKKYRVAKDYAEASLSEFEKDIRSTGFYKNKAKNIINTAIILTEQFNSQVPYTMSKLLQLPGVARKTATLVLSNAYGKVEGSRIEGAPA